jgi:hypothetical protein
MLPAICSRHGHAGTGVKCIHQGGCHLSINPGHAAPRGRDEGRCEILTTSRAPKLFIRRVEGAMADTSH